MNRRIATREAKRPMRERPKMFPISEEMKEWAALLEGELREWPGVKSRPMFGMTGFYRGTRMFAALPRTRAIGTSNSIIFKFGRVPHKRVEELKNDPRVDTDRKRPAEGWWVFELRTAEDIQDALKWLSLAFEKRKT